MSGWLEGHPGLPRLLAGLHDLDAERGDMPMSLAEHVAVHGELPRCSARELIGQIERSGLRGRGGADYPTARKLAAVATGRKRPAAVIVNGSETEPASAKDRLLLSKLPHLVLDGAVLAAAAIGAPEVIVQINESARGSLAALEGALAVRNDSRVNVRVISSAGGYVSGEESAVINHLNRGLSLPTFVPPRPFERGYRGRSTLVQNPETLAQIALVARFGEVWYRELGTAADPGSALVTISGAVAVPGVYELAFGCPMTELLAAAGGATEPLRALLIGGYFGTWMDARRVTDLKLARDDLRSVGCALGSGVLIALGESACGLHESARVIDYLAAQSAGQCGPCVYGLRAIADAVGEIASGVAHQREQQRVQRWITEVRGRGACHHPDGATRFIASALSVFSREIESHRHGRCSAQPAGLPVGAFVTRDTLGASAPRHRRERSLR
jgi:NADH:ubiquinone oxidoreductase subunit F (NADH-binding)